MSAAFLKQSGTNIRPTSCYKQPSWSNSRCNVRKCVLLKRISEGLAFNIDGARRLFWSWSDEERKVHAVVWIFGACLVACPPSPPFFLDLLFPLFLHQSLKCRHLPRSGLLHSSCLIWTCYKPINLWVPSPVLWNAALHSPPPLLLLLTVFIFASSLVLASVKPIFFLSPTWIEAGLLVSRFHNSS